MSKLLSRSGSLFLNEIQHCLERQTPQLRFRQPTASPTRAGESASDWWAPLDHSDTIPVLEPRRTLSRTLIESWTRQRAASPPPSLRSFGKGDPASSVKLLPCYSPPGSHRTSSVLSAPKLFKAADVDRSLLQRLAARFRASDSPAATGATTPIGQRCEKVAAALDVVVLTAEAADKAHQHGHDHGGGAIVVDLDEAIHGLYAAVAYLVQALKGNAGGIVQQFRESGLQLQTDPVGFLRQSGIPSGPADLGISAGVGCVLAPLAIMALKAGIEEMRGARHTHRALKADIRDAKRDMAAMDRLVRRSRDAIGTSASGLGTQQLRTTQKLADLQFVASQNIAGGMVGVFSTTAGGAILAKVGLDVASKSTFIATGGHGAAATLSGIDGIVGTAALAPVAALSSLGLGGAMVHKSRSARGEFKLRSQPTRAALRANTPPADPTIAEYLDFVRIKLDQRDYFNTHYLNWNAGFLAASSLYSGASLAKLTLVAVAASGVVIGSKGVALAALLAAGTVAGLTMALCSHQFLAGHGKQHRYQGYRCGQDAELDRDFLAAVDLADDGDPWSGLRLRAGCLQQLATRDRLRQELLRDAAKAIGKRFDDGQVHSTDPEHVIEQSGGRPAASDMLGKIVTRRREDMAGRIKAASRFAGQLAHGHGLGSAKTVAQDTWNGSRDHLTRTHLRRWLRDGGSQDRQIAALGAMLQPQLAFLETKLLAKERAYDAVLGKLADELEEIELRSPPGAPDTEILRDNAVLSQLMVQLHEDLTHDRALVAQAHDLRFQLEALAKDVVLRTPERLATAIDCFLETQCGNLVDDAERPSLDDSHAKLAEYLLKGAPKRYRDLRGLLLETELSANKLRSMTDLAPVDPQEKGGPLPGRQV